MTLLPTKTPTTFARKLASPQSRTWLPPALLLLALSSVFIFGGDRGHFYRESNHNFLSAERMAIAENLSIDHNFVAFTHLTLNPDGKVYPFVYNRYPIGNYALIRLAILPFGDDLSAKIYAARMLMLLFFAAAAILAYLALCRLASNRWIALTAALLAFSSPYLLYFNDAITNEISMELFAALLVFHGMVIFEQDKLFRQLAVKTCIALLLGWHVYALLLPFIAFGLLRQLVKTRLDGSVHPLALRQLRHTALSLIRSRYMALGAVALLFGVSMLTFNLTNEYFALNREATLTSLPSFQSIMKRTGFSENMAFLTERRTQYVAWPAFPERQFHRIGAMSLPYAFSPSFVEDLREVPPRQFVILGIAVSAASLLGLLFVRRHKILLAALALSGFCWALPMRYNTAFPWHSHQAIIYIGVTLTLFLLILLCLRRLSGERFVAALSIAALLIFAFSALRMSQLNNPDQPTAEIHDAAIAEFEVIRNMTDGKAMLVNAMPRFHDRIAFIHYYYLAGRVIINEYENVHPASPPDFVVTGIRSNLLPSLTPQNEMIFLYEWDDYHNRIDEAIEQAGEPLIRYDFDVYLNDNTLIYVKDDCSEDDAAASFFLGVYPEDENDLSAERRQHGFDNLLFHLQDRVIWRGERCLTPIPIPEYDIDYIHTGQRIYYEDDPPEHKWEWAANFETPAFLVSLNVVRPKHKWAWAGNPHRRHLLYVDWAEIDETIAQAGEPITRSEFDVRVNDNALIYVKDACGEDDVDAPFFLALYPVDESDLPDEARQYGFDNLDFSIDFRVQENSIRGSGERCAAIVRLPEYDIDYIYTGQYILQADGSRQTKWEWSGNPYIRDILSGKWAEIRETIAQADEPLIRSDFFDVYLNNNELIYVNDACGEDDVDAPFFLALYPVDESDLPDEARQYGFENLDFGFSQNGIRQGERRCVAVVQIPDYDIVKIYTGQYIQRADGSFENLWGGEIHLTEIAN